LGGAIVLSFALGWLAAQYEWELPSFRFPATAPEHREKPDDALGGKA
jgi:hypothetical protein